MSRPAVLVTGAARRLGAAIARSFADEGWHVVIHYGSSAAEAEALADALPSAETVHCDLADSAAAARMVRALAERLGDWRALVNSAAIFRYDDVTSFDAATYARSMQINAQTPVAMTRAYFAHARSAGGRHVIEVTDQKLANPNPDFLSYTMSKHALAAAIPMFAKVPVARGDRIYGLAPGAILASHDQSEDETEHSHVLNLLRRRTAPEEIGAAAVFLAGGHLASGTTLFVDSGQHLLDQDRDVIYLARGEA